MANFEDMQAGSNSGSYSGGRSEEEADMNTEPHTRRNSLEEPHRPRQHGLMLSQPTFDRKVPDRYVELLNF